MNESAQPTQPQQSAQTQVAPVVELTPYQRRKAAMKREMEEAQLFEQLGQKIIKVKARTLKLIGEHLQDCGVRQIGHGRIAVAAENASNAFVRCGEFIDRFAAINPMEARCAIVELFQLQAAFNKQVLESGEAHLRADKQPDAPQKGATPMQAYPAGGTVIMVNAAPTPQPPALQPPPP